MSRKRRPPVKPAISPEIREAAAEVVRRSDDAIRRMGEISYMGVPLGLADFRFDNAPIEHAQARIYRDILGYPDPQENNPWHDKPLTKEQWKDSEDPLAMLFSLTRLADHDGSRIFSERTHNRKARLWACGFLRLVWHGLISESRRSVRAAEEFADGLIPIHTMRRAITTDDSQQAGFAAACCCDQRAYVAADNVRHYIGRCDEVSLKTQADLLRCVIGDSTMILGAWAADRNVQGIATACYEEHDWPRLPILADAMEDAGCVDTAILSHFRGDGPHCRGCHPLDLILGKGRIDVVDGSDPRPHESYPPGETVAIQAGQSVQVGDQLAYDDNGLVVPVRQGQRWYMTALDSGGEGETIRCRTHPMLYGLPIIVDE